MCLFIKYLPVTLIREVWERLQLQSVPILKCHPWKHPVENHDHYLQYNWGWGWVSALSYSYPVQDLTQLSVPSFPCLPRLLQWLLLLASFLCGCLLLPFPHIIPACSMSSHRGDPLQLPCSPSRPLDSCWWPGALCPAADLGPPVFPGISSRPSCLPLKDNTHGMGPILFLLSQP